MTVTFDRVASNAILSTMIEGNTYGSKAIRRSISTLKQATAKTDCRAHATAVAILYRSLPDDMGGSRDCSLAVSLVQSLGLGGRAKAMIQWFHRYTNIRFVQPKGSTLAAKMLNEKHVKMYRKLTSDDVDVARQEPYWNTPTSQPKAFSLTDESFIKRLSTLLEDCANDEATVMNADNLALIAAANRRVIAHKAAVALAAQPAATVAKAA